MISPTGKGLRKADKWGKGCYGASRGKGMRLHKGADYVCEPGQDIIAPIGGIIARESRPYGEPDWLYRYSGLIMYNELCNITLFYLEPLRFLIGTTVRMGDKIGIAQDISEKYAEMVPHIHLQINSIDPELFMNFL